MKPYIPTSPQRSLLRALAEKPGRFLRDRFDGANSYFESNGDYASVRGATHGQVVNACHRRGWISYTIVKYGQHKIDIERRYTITSEGAKVI